MSPAELESAAEEILTAELSEASAKRLESLMSSVGYTTTALFGIELWLREQGDGAGAAMVGALCRQFAEHEAATL